MADRETVIYDIERCICHVPDACRDCSRYGHDDDLRCMEALMSDAMELLKEQEDLGKELENAIELIHKKNARILKLLKEQEAVKPRVSSVEQRCGNCNKVIEMDGWKACPWCGKPIRWEAVGRKVKCK